MKIQNKKFDIKIISKAEYSAHSFDIFYEIFKSPFGFCLVASTEIGICNVLFGDNENDVFKDLEKRWKNFNLKTKKKEIHNLVKKYLKREISDTKIPIHLYGTDFQLNVWSELLKIPKGKSLTYKDVSISLGDKNLSRAVGSATGKNPIGYLIPCHRVLRTDGGIGGYRWGNERKNKMIKSESI